MLRYLAILRLREQGLSLRSIAASTGNSRQKVTEVIDRATDKGLMGPFDDDMTDKWIEEFLFPEKTLESSGRHPIDFDYVHKELAKPNVTLSLLHVNARIKLTVFARYDFTLLPKNQNRTPID